MLNPHSLAAYSSHILDSSEDTELEQRLGLYRVFLKLYEHHRSLLDEILALENPGSKTLTGVAPQYVQGVVQGQQAHLMTNLLEGTTQALFQPQNIWTIGRDRHAAIAISDRRLSRRHAVIQYIENQGFYLVDLESTNGSFVNGELVRHRVPIKDGDRIRLGSMTFAFFVCHLSRTLDAVPSELLSHLKSLETLSTAVGTPLSSQASPKAIAPPADIPLPDRADETSLFLNPKSPISEPVSTSASLKTSASQQAEILDRFLNKRSRSYRN